MRVTTQHISKIHELWQTQIGQLIKQIKGYNQSIEWANELIKNPNAYICNDGVYEFVDILKGNKKQAKVIFYSASSNQLPLIEEAKKTAFEELGLDELLFQIVEPKLVLLTRDVKQAVKTEELRRGEEGDQKSKDIAEVSQPDTSSTKSKSKRKSKIQQKERFAAATTT